MSRHKEQAQHGDVVGRVLTAAWGLGHLVALSLLTDMFHHELIDDEPHTAAGAANTAADTEPTRA